MIKEFDEHLEKLRSSYINATFTQRCSIARQRLDNPDCMPNQLCNNAAALEAVARALAIELLVKKGHTVEEAYKKVVYKTTTQIIKQFICPELDKTPEELIGDSWPFIEYVEKYRNLLTHEGTYLRSEYAEELIEVCQLAIEKLESIGVNKVKTEELCSDCQTLVGASRHAAPHANLVCTERKAIGTIMGAADEAYYTCKVCGHDWLHETGSCGYGWIK